MTRTSRAVLLLLLCCPVANANELPEAPKPKFTKTERLLTLGNGTLAFSDVAYTQTHPSGVEDNPLARPFIRHRPLVYGMAAGETVGLAWLGHRMRKSQRWHRVWWLPQTAGIAAHGYALGKSVYNWRQ